MNEFIKKLEPLIDVRKDFKEWFNNDGQEVILMDLQTFIKLPFILQIGIWLKYLQDNNLQIIVYHRAWYIYYIDKDKITHKQFKYPFQDRDMSIQKIIQAEKDMDYDLEIYLDYNLYPSAIGYEDINKLYEEAIFKGLEYIDKTIKFPPF